MNKHKKSRSAQEWVGLIVLVVLAALFLSACNEDEIASLPEAANVDRGVYTNVPLSQFTSQGFSVCYQDTYADSGTPLSTILAGCSGTFLMLACRTNGSPTLDVAAYARFEDVTYPTAGTLTDVHNANGVAWYYNTNWSWGFAVAGDAVEINSCDFSGGGVTGTYPGKKLCFHAGGGAIQGGYRCGANEGVGSGYDRLVLRRG